jgi:hypothetical protein
MALYANNNTTAPVWVVSAPTIYNVTMTNADTEYSQLLPAGCKRFAMSVIGGAAADIFRVAFVTGKVATPTAPYLQYPGDVEYFEDDVNLAAQTVFFADDSAGKVMQIVAWV